MLNIIHSGNINTDDGGGNNNNFNSPGLWPTARETLSQLSSLNHSSYSP